MKTTRVTLSTIASLTGVNASTVSRALNPRTFHLVNVQLRSRISSVCDELGYRPDLLGRSFATGRTFKVGFISGSLQNDLSSPPLAELLSGLAGKLQSCNYSLTLLPYYGGQHGDSLQQLLMSDVADAYILGMAMLDSQTRDMLVNSRRLVLALDLHQWREQDVFSSLMLDLLPTYQQVWRVLPPSWRRQVLFIGESCVNTDYKLAHVRLSAKVCDEPDLDIAVQILPQLSTDFTITRYYAFLYGEDHWRELAKYKLLWCPSDLTALGLSDALSRRGLRIGEDIFLLGQDNIESLYGSVYQPFLTSIDPCMQDAGVKAAELLLQKLNSGEANSCIQKIKMPAKLIFRRSFPNNFDQKL